VKGHGQLNIRIIFETVLMLFTKHYHNSQCLLKLQLAKVGAFSRHIVYQHYIIVQLHTSMREHAINYRVQVACDRYYCYSYSGQFCMR